MRLLRALTYSASAVALALTLSAGANAQRNGQAQQRDDAERGCKAHAGLSTGAVYDDIYVQRTRGSRSNNGNYELTWEAWVADDRALTGRCEADVRGTVVTFQRIAEHPGRKPNSGSQGGLGRLNVTSQGRGSFNGLGMNGSIDSANVVMQEGRATVVLSGGGNRVTILGAVTAQPRSSEFTIQIDGTDRSRNATGTVQIRMNRDSNEVMTVNVNGQAGRQQFSGNFSR